MGHGQKAESALNLLKRDILNGTHPPGQALPLSSLTARYGLGAASLRAALTQLAGIRLVEPAVTRGWRVASVCIAEFEDLLYARMSLELLLIEDAIENGTLDWETNLVAAHYQLAQAVRPVGDADTLAYRQTWIAVHDAFHTALLAGARSAWLKRIHTDLMGELQRYHQAVMSQLHARTEAQEPLLAKAFSTPRHTALMVAALDRDKAAATTALQSHNDVANAIFQQFLGKRHPAQ